MTERFRMDLRLAGLPYRLDVDAADRRWLEHRYSAYADPDDAPFTLEVVSDPSRPIAQPPGATYPGPTCLDDGKRLEFLRRHEHLMIDAPRRRARLVTDQRSGLFSDRAAPPVEASLRILLSLELVARGGLLLHACGIATDRGAVAFPALSGGGKTTTARKFAHEEVLSDDQVAITREPGGWVAHALPFVGEYQRQTVPQSRPLRALAFLGKAADPLLTPLRAAGALSRLLACVVQYRPADAARALDLATRLVADVPAFELGLARDTPVAPYLAEIIR